MILRSSSASPFARKVRLASIVLGFAEDIEIIPADTSDPDEALRAQNPLGKIPTLVLDDGRAIYDSAVILEFLDYKAGGGRLIPTDDTRFEVLTRAALADGVADAALLMVYERRWRESASHSQRWIAHQTGKVSRGLTALQENASDPKRVDVASIALACALGYLDLRFGGTWRENHEGLVKWLQTFSSNFPAFEQTRHVEGQQSIDSATDIHRQTSLRLEKLI
jgi:glutathione S-transferase